MRSFTALLILTLLPLSAQKFRADDPMEFELKPLTAGDALRRRLSDYYDAIVHTMATPGQLNRDLKDPIPSQAVNTLGEPLQGAWWVKRHYYSRMSLKELIAGPGLDHAPSTAGRWTVVGAKTEGITPGFVMVDEKKELYFIKFDPLTNPEMATGADHVAIRLVHALGYHVPENYLVEFPEDILVLGKDVKIADRLGRRRLMTRADLTGMLLKVPRTKGGMYRATASRAIPGKSLGPYRYYGRRNDDPNDFILHEHRRDLRGFAVVSAWIDHDDSRAINTYDSLVEESGAKFIRHYILDLGSALGSGTQQANSPRSGGEYLFGWKQSAIQLFTLGLAVPYWATAHYPHLPSVGRFDYAKFDPERWVPEYPNPAFLNRLPDDEFWAAKQIMSLRDEEIRAIVSSAKYSDPRAEAWLVECLIKRRDKIGKAYFGKVLPLDRFAVRDGKLVFEDLSESTGLGSSGPFSVQWFEVNNATGVTTPINGATSFALNSEGAPWKLARIVSAGRPRQFVDVTVRIDSGAPAVIGIDRRW